MDTKTKLIHKFLGDGKGIQRLFKILGFEMNYKAGSRGQGWILFFRNKDETIGGYVAKKISKK